MSDVADFLRARLDEDERIALAAKGQLVQVDGFDESHEHLQRWGSARVLREVEAKRRVLDDCQLATTGSALAMLVVRHLASAHASHADYRQEWAP